MDYYYKKSLGNGAMASKFRLEASNPVQQRSSDIRQGSRSEQPQENGSQDCKNSQTPAIPALTAKSSRDESVALTKAAESASPNYHSNNCNRCYRLKKKCSREHPRCGNCAKSGSECEYIDRNTKRRRKTPSLNSAEADKDVFIHVDSQMARTQDLNISNPGSVAKIIERKDNISISSLLSEDNHKGRSFVDKLVHKSMKSSHSDSNQHQDDYINMRPIADLELPSRLARDFFHNYETKCPFMDESQFMSDLSKVDFTKESIISMEMYLLLCVGCLIHDKICNTNWFKTYFSENIVESILDIIEFSSVESLKLVLLLTIYSIHSYQQDLSWELLGILVRQIVKRKFYKTSSSTCDQQTELRKRIFWSVYNLDKFLSLLLEVPSQIPPDNFISLELPSTGFSDHESDLILGLIHQEIAFSKLLNRLLYLKLTKESKDFEQLKILSADLDKWRVAISKEVHQCSYIEPESYITLIHINYYYFLIELDQISSSESFQFTLQFLSNSFSLIITDNDDEKSKKGLEFGLLTSFWYSQLFKVVDYSLESLDKIVQIEANLNSMETSLKLSEFNSNLQLMVNLFKYLTKQTRHQENFIKKLSFYSVQLNNLGQKVMKSLMIGNDRSGIHDSVHKVRQALQ